MRSRVSEWAACVVYEVTGDYGMSATTGATQTTNRCDVLRSDISWPLRRGLPLHCGLLMLGMFLVLPIAAQTQPVHHKKAAAKAPVAPDPAPAVPVGPIAPPNMLDQPAVPATVTARKNVLAVTADNSSLTQILHQISTETGMQLDGLGGDERVFGSFGPGVPREVLTSLLNGTAYNVVMVGNLPNGAPRQLMLLRRDGSGSAGSPAASPQHSTGDDDSPADDTGNADDPDEPPPPPPMQAVPQGQPIPQGVRTPQQWQQIQQMRNLQTTAPPE